MTAPETTTAETLTLAPEQTRWETYAPQFEALQQAELTPAGVPSWLADWSEVSKAVSQAGAVLSLRADLDTADLAARDALSTFRAEVLPPLSRAEQNLRRKLLSTGSYTPAPDFALAYRRMRSEAARYREANVALEVEHQRQMQRHAEITGGQTVTFDGAELTVPEAESLLGSADRTRREQVWRAVARSQAAGRAPLNALVLELLGTRRQLAVNADLTNTGPDNQKTGDYRAYRWQELDRVDYTPQDCLDFHQAVLDEVVPLATQLMESKARQLGLESLRPWDASRRTSLDAQGRPPLTPFKTAPELEGLAERVFDALIRRWAHSLLRCARGCSIWIAAPIR